MYIYMYIYIYMIAWTLNLEVSGTSISAMQLNSKPTLKRFDLIKRVTCFFSTPYAHEL